MNQAYAVLLTYGYLDNQTDGIFHAFRVMAPESSMDCDEVSESLAQQLCTSSDDTGFNWDMMTLELPKELVDKIRADAVRDYRAGLY